MNRLEKSKKIIKLFKIKAKLEYSDDFAVLQNKTPTVFIKKENTILNGIDKTIDEEQRKLIQTELVNNWISIDYDLFGLLHEIGHIKANNRVYDQKYTQDTMVLSTLFDENLIGVEDYIKLYNGLDMERQANNWAIGFILADERFKKIKEIWES